MGALVSLAAKRAARTRKANAPAPTAAVVSALAVSAAVRDWIETQARVIEYWRDLLLAAGEQGELVAALDAHAAFLSGVAARG